MTSVRRLVPRIVRHGLSAQLARVHAGRLDRDLARLAAGDDTIVAGPWLGEVGFELLYWVPFLRWFVSAYRVTPDRLLIVSRGGTAAWYRPFAAGYREIFDYLTPHEFRRRHDERVTTNGEQKQTRVLAFEHDLLRDLTRDVRSRSMLHPSSMFGLFNPFWWGHVDERWIHRRAQYCVVQSSAAPHMTLPDEPYTAVKFYFNDCFPPTERNREFVRSLTAQGPVVSLATGLHLDDHGGDEAMTYGVQSLPPEMRPQDNLAIQTAVVAGAARFVGTYGGFSYLAPFVGVRSTAYYDDPNGFSRRHLMMAQSAFRAIGKDGFLDVRSASGDSLSTTGPHTA